MSSNISGSTPTTAAPAPPPNAAKPLPQPGASGASANHLNSSNFTGTSQIPLSNRSSSPGSSGTTTPDRRSAGDNGSPAPPIVVVSSDTSSDHRSSAAGDSVSHTLDHGNVTPPRATTLNRLRAAPRDTIPIVGKPPRKQRSSRFVVTEKVEIERLPPFLGEFIHLKFRSQYLEIELCRYASKRASAVVYQKVTSMSRSF